MSNVMAGGGWLGEASQMWRELSNQCTSSTFCDGAIDDFDELLIEKLPIHIARLGRLGHLCVQ